MTIDTTVAVRETCCCGAKLVYRGDQPEEAGRHFRLNHRHEKTSDQCCDRVGQPGTWVAYYSDMSGVVLFSSELEAARHAVEHSMEVVFVRDGQDVQTAGREARS